MGGNNKANISTSRRTYLKTVAAGSAVGLAGCSGPLSGGGTSQISLMRPGSPDRVREYLDPAVEEFREENDDIEVEIIDQGWGGWQDRLFNMLSQGEQPHVQLLPDYYQNIILDRRTLVSLGDKLDGEIIDQNMWWDKPPVSGTHYVLPAGVSGTNIMYYNKDIMEEAGLDPSSPPATFEEFFTQAQQIDENTDKPGMGQYARQFLTTVTSWSIFLGGWVEDIFLDEPNGEVTFDTPEGVTATEEWVKTKEVAQPNPVSTSRGSVRESFAAGDLGFVFDLVFMYPLLRENYDLTSDDHPIGFAKIPEGPAGRNQFGAFDGWAITREENTEASTRLINHLAQKEWQIEHSKAFGGLPVR